MKARSAKAKGTRLEKWCMQAFQAIGWKARKQPGSGIYSAFPHDVYAEHPERGPIVCECKSWKNGWRTGDTALGQADILVIKRDYGEPNVYMPWRVFAQLLSVDEP